MSREKSLVRIKKPKNLNTIFGLPAKSYTDENFWKKECKTVLSDGWLFVGFVHEFKKPGDVIPLFIADKPIFPVVVLNITKSSPKIRISLGTSLTSDVKATGCQ